MVNETPCLHEERIKSESCVKKNEIKMKIQKTSRKRSMQFIRQVFSFDDKWDPDNGSEKEKNVNLKKIKISSFEKQKSLPGLVIHESKHLSCICQKNMND